MTSDAPTLFFAGRFEYDGFHGCPSACFLHIYKTIGGSVCIATELDDNPGTSVTNMVEGIVLKAIEQFRLEPGHLLWIEHYPAPQHRWDLVQFNYQIVRPITTAPGFFYSFDHPRWRPISEDVVTALCGELPVIP